MSILVDVVHELVFATASSFLASRAVNQSGVRAVSSTGPMDPPQVLQMFLQGFSSEKHRVELVHHNIFRACFSEQCVDAGMQYPIRDL
jgi:hypothetical protein